MAVALPKRTVEKLFNVLLGLSVISWSAIGIWESNPEARMSAVRLCIALFNVVVGALILARQSQARQGDLRAVALCLPSFVICGWAFKSAQPVEHWPLHAEIIFAGGAAWAMVSFLQLGRSFAVFPALRSIVTAGPYRWVRHPAYQGELTMIAACILSNPLLLSLALIALAFPAVALRIVAEERLLASDAAYRQYQQQVRWRLLPGVW